MVTFESDALTKLSSPDQLELLNAIDRLRLQGINNYVSLPQIIVCGDQSSGKSSVLEAISGVSFPVKSNLCTRFPTELVLRRSPHISASVSIVPHESRSESERLALSGFKESLNGFSALPSVIESAKLAMGITMHGKAFSKDRLRIEISGPNHPHLTIVDLPGLIHSETKHQTASDVELIQEVVQSYMEEPRSIILAVVSAKNDFANQVVLKLARKADSTGNRTLGVITKPDTLTPGSESESLFVSLARNHEFVFRLGWHVLKNMDSEKGPGNPEDRDSSEAEFFSRGIWTNLPLASLGIGRLRGRLSKVLLGQIASELPGLIKEIDGKFKACHSQLEKLGTPRATEPEQRRYLFEVGQSFQALVKSSVDASYNHPFFEDAKTEKGYSQRIRAIVQNLNDDFASSISSRGHFRTVLEGDGVSLFRSAKAVTKNEFLDHIEELMHRTRGRELPGTFNPMIVAELFREQSQPWEAIARRHVEKVWDATCKFLVLVISYLADDSTSNILQREVFEPAMRNILNQLRDKTSELLKPHQSGHPITYNHYFTETLQAVRRERLGLRKDIIDIIKETFDLSENSALTTEHYLCSGHFNLKGLADRLEGQFEPDMDRFAAKEARDCLDAYYKVALKRFIDDISVQVVEEKLISELGDILSPVSVFGMEAAQVTRIAGESEESRALREDLTKQLGILSKGLETCKRFAGLRIGGDSVFVAKNGVSSAFEPNWHPGVLECLGHDEVDSDPISGAPTPDSHRPVASAIRIDRSYKVGAKVIKEQEPEPEPAQEYGPPPEVSEPPVEAKIEDSWGNPSASKKKKKKGRAMLGDPVPAEPVPAEPVPTGSVFSFD